MYSKSLIIQKLKYKSNAFSDSFNNKRLKWQSKCFSNKKRNLLETILNLFVIFKEYLSNTKPT